LRIFIAFLVAVLASAAGIADATADGCTPRRQAELAVIFLRNIPLVNLTVNGAPATFVLDTGAERTIITAAAAQRLGVESHFEYPRRMRGLDGALSSGDARLRSLGLGGTALADLKVLVGSLSLSGPTGKPLDGLLGADFFSSFEVDLDLAHGRLALYQRLSCAIVAPPWRQPYATVPVNRSLHDHLFFPVTLDGHRFAAFIDIGAELRPSMPGRPRCSA
jgi:aspartyl protease